MKILKLLIPVLFAVMVLSACCGGKAVPSGLTVLQGGFELDSFTAGQVDSVQIKEYLNGTNFTQVLDSMPYIVSPPDSGSMRSYIKFDSVKLSVPDTAINFLVYFPSAGLTYKVTNITRAAYCSKCGLHTSCEPYTTGYTINGNPYTLGYFGTSIVIIK
jgi:hypothetical protein